MSIPDPPSPPSEPESDLERDEVLAESVGERIDDGKGRIFPCEGCGADLVFHIGQQRLKCPYCGFEKEIELGEDQEIREQDFLAMLEKLREQRTGDTPPVDADSHEVRCGACGGIVQFRGTLISSSCPYCASPLQRDDVQESQQKIAFDAVLPFLIDRGGARERLQSWMKSRWFAPSALRKHRVSAVFEGVYLPYWTFDTLAFTRYVGQRGGDYTVYVGTGKNRRAVTRTRWYPARGAFQRFFDDVLVPASTGLPARSLNQLAPWPLQKSLPFTQEALAGFYARVYDVELDQGFAIAKARIDEALARDVRRRIGGDRQRVESIRSRYDAITYKLVLLPVWMLVYRFRGKPYQVLVNAGTGEVVGERPYSWVKITLAVVAAAAAAAGLYLLAKARGG